MINRVCKVGTSSMFNDTEGGRFALEQRELHAMTVESAETLQREQRMGLTRI